jgi:hypothetical protein
VAMLEATSFFQCCGWKIRNHWNTRVYKYLSIKITFPCENAGSLLWNLSHCRNWSQDQIIVLVNVDTTIYWCWFDLHQTGIGQ